MLNRKRCQVRIGSQVASGTYRSKKFPEYRRMSFRRMNNGGGRLGQPLVDEVQSFTHFQWLTKNAGVGAQPQKSE